MKLTISYCPNKTTFPLSFDADLAELGPNLEKFYYSYHILYVYYKFFKKWWKIGLGSIGA